VPLTGRRPAGAPDPGAIHRRFARDEAGNLVEVADRDRGQTSNTYDLAGRITADSAPGAFRSTSPTIRRTT
jgi:YD repeat-containing protein